MNINAIRYKIDSIMLKHHIIYTNVRESIVDFKVLQIAKVINENPISFNDADIMVRVILFSDESKTPEICRIQEEWLKRFCFTNAGSIVKFDFKPFEMRLDCLDFINKNFQRFLTTERKAKIMSSLPKELGRFDVNHATLTFTEESFKKINENVLWNFIKTEAAQKLVIQHNDGQRTEYEEFILRLMLEKRPAPSTFFENCTFVFKEGPIVVSKAVILVCGDFFQSFLSGRFTVPDSVDFTLSPVTFTAFKTLLKFVHTGENDNELCKTALDYLLFDSNFAKIPEGCLGLELFEAKGGKLTDFTPLQWMKWALAIDGMKKDFPDGIIYGIDPGLSIAEMGKYIEGATTDYANKIVFDKPRCKESYENTTSKPCLFVRPKRMPTFTFNKVYKTQVYFLNIFSENRGRLYKPQTIRETVAIECLYLLKNGKSISEEYGVTFSTNTSDSIVLPNGFMWADKHNWVSFKILIDNYIKNTRCFYIHTIYESNYFLGLVPCRNFYKNDQ